MTDTTLSPADGVLTELRAIRKLLADARPVPASLLADARPVPASLLDRPALAALLDIGVSTLDRMKASGQIGPPEVRVGGAVRWHRAGVEAWLAYRTPTGELYDTESWPPVWADLQRRRK